MPHGSRIERLAFAIEYAPAANYHEEASRGCASSHLREELQNHEDHEDSASRLQHQWREIRQPALTATAAEQLKKVHPDAEYIYRDLIKNTLPHYTRRGPFFDGNADHVTEEEKAELATGKEIPNEFLISDIVIVAAPMYNFNIPSQLKAWVDLIVVPGVTFKYGANGAEGQCAGKRVVILSSRGGMYGPGSPFETIDFQEKYLRAVFSFLGIKTSPSSRPLGPPPFI